MTKAQTFVGRDVAKAWLDVVVGPDGGKPLRVRNTRSGWQQIITRVAELADPLIVLEATGAYHQGLVVALDGAGYTPAVSNPLLTKRYGQSKGNRAKTDRRDALLLAQYGEQIHPTPRPVPCLSLRTLQARVQRREAVTKMITMEKNRRHTADRANCASCRRMIAVLAEEHARIDAQIAQIIASDPVLKERVALLCTVPGIGLVLAAVIVVGLPELGLLTPNEIAALIGLPPYARESGTKIGK